VISGLGACWPPVLRLLASSSWRHPGRVVFPFLAIRQEGKQDRAQRLLHHVFLFYLAMLRCIGLIRLESSAVSG